MQMYSKVCVLKGLGMRLLAAHTVIKVNLRGCQRLCSLRLIETISYLLIPAEGIREQGTMVSFSG